VNFNSRKKTKSSKNMSSLGIDQARLNPREGREDPGRAIVIRWERVQGVAAAVVVEGGGVDVVDVVEEGEGKEGTLVTGPPRTRTNPRGAITTGNEVMTRRWRGEGRHLRSAIVHRYAAEL
jgi:hypothetical protein